MALKTYNPVTPSTRQLVLVDRSALYKGKPVKGLTEGLTKSGGRNNYGRITARFIGGGHKRSYRIIDFKPSVRPFTGLPLYRPERSTITSWRVLGVTGLNFFSAMVSVPRGPF